MIILMCSVSGFVTLHKLNSREKVFHQPAFVSKESVVVDGSTPFVAYYFPNWDGIQYFAGMSQQWYTKKWVHISFHIFWWLLFFGFPFLLQPIREGETPHLAPFNLKGFYYLHFANNTLRMVLFYANAYIFIPRLVYKRKIFQYIIVLLATLGLLLCFDRLFFSLFVEGFRYRVWNFLAFHLPVFVFLIIASTSFRIIRDRIAENQRSRERETETLKTELSFLRSQISPHFMFNVLNGMVALARKKSDELEPSLIRLSQLLRYMLYETDEDKVSLQKEVEYLQSYVDLQKQRFGKNITINTRFEPGENSYSIEPMLLVPFVENAFKHGTGMISDAEIDIHLWIKENVLGFTVRNRYIENAVETKDKTSGIGLSNVQRRLNLLYDKNHSIQIQKKDGWFVVQLHINLH